MHTRPGYAYLQDIAAEVLTVLNLECDTLALSGYGGAGLDFVVTVSAFVTVRRHNEDIL